MCQSLMGSHTVFFFCINAGLLSQQQACLSVTLPVTLLS